MRGITRRGWLAFAPLAAALAGLKQAFANDPKRPIFDAGPKPPTVDSAESARVLKLVQGDLSVAKNEEERYYALGKAAKLAWEKGEKDQAKALASELEGLIPKYKTNWNHGNAVQDSNQVLGLLALAGGDVAEARKRLLASAESKGSPQMNSFGPNMRLAKALLEKGEKEVVLQYFERCGKFWDMGSEQLARWKQEVEKGATPDFGANLKY